MTRQSNPTRRSDQTGRPTPQRQGSRTLRTTTAMVTLVAAATTGTVAVTASPALASWHAATVGSWTPDPGVALRDCYHPSVQLPPSTSCTFITYLRKGTAVHVVCQRSGQTIGGNNVWDYVVYSGGEGFVSDYYMNTEHANWIPGIDVCS